MKKFLLILFATALYVGNVGAQLGGKALSLDGSNDKVVITTSPSLNITSTITIEAWINYSKITGTQDVVSKSSNTANNSYLFPRTSDGWRTVEFLLKFNGNPSFTVLKVDYSTFQHLFRNQWHHLAATYDGFFMRIYIDGVLAGSKAASGMITANNNPLVIGAHTDFSNEYFGGKVDDIRIWNRPLSGCEIASNRNCELTGSESGLAAYYKLNQGLADLPNLLETTVYDETANDNDGQLQSFLLSGLTSNWTGGIVTGACTPFTPVQATAGSLEANIAVGSDIHLTASGGDSYSWVGPNGFTSTEQNPVIPSASILASGTYTVMVTRNGCSASASTQVTVAYRAKALHFDGQDADITIPNSPSFNNFTALTIETWVYPTSNVPVVQSILSKSAASTNSGYIFPRTDDGWQTYSFWLTINGQWKVVSAPFAGRNQWTHVAASYDGYFMKLYMNGILVGSLAVQGSITDNSNDLRIGRQTGLQEFYKGAVDEMRVWSRALTECEILNNMNCELNGADNGLSAVNGLSAYYRFNQGLINADNTPYTTLADSSGHNNNGVLQNFELTGISSNWGVGGTVNDFSCERYESGGTPAATSNGPIVEVGTTIELHATDGSAWAWTGPNGFTSTQQHPTIPNSTLDMSGVYTVVITDNGCTSTVSTQLKVAYKAGTLHFDGVNDHVRIPNAPSLNASKEITLEAWIKPTNNSTRQIQDVICKSTKDVNTGYIFPRTDDAWTNAVFYLHINGVWEKLYVPYPSLNTWHHLAATYDGYYMRIYIDGALAGSKVLPNGGDITLNANDLVLGDQPGIETREFFEGTVEEARVWDRALSQCEIINNMNCEVGQLQNNGLAAYYKFNQGFLDSDNRSITSVTDYGPNANHGSLVDFASEGLTSNWSATKISGTCSTYAKPPVAAGANGTHFNVGSTIVLYGSGGTTYTWDGPNNFVATGEAPSIYNVQLNATGVYTVTSPFVNCVITASTRLTVSPLQSITANGPTTFCPSGSVTLTSPNTGLSYQWFRNDQPIDGATNSSLVATLSGDYTIKVTRANEILVSEPVPVLVQDNIAPTPVVASLPVINVYTDVVIASVPTAIDNCTGNITGTTQSPLSYAVPGTYTITWVYNDGNNNTSTQTQTVIVEKAPDVVAPVITVPGNITQNNDANICGAAVSFTATATDESPFTITYSLEPGTVFPVGTTIVTITATDAANNTSTANFTITVVDAQAPVITVPADINAASGTGINVGTATATDNCGTAVITHTAIPSVFSLGTTNITWTATDAVGNSVSAVQKVTVTDSEAPVLSGVPANTSVTCGVLPAVPVVTATDNFDASPVVTMTTTTNGSIVTRTWTAVDASGNTASASQVITLIPDTQAPVMTAPANVTSTSGTGINIGTATAVDNCSTPVITHSAVPSTFGLGVTNITWTATDAAGNTTTGIQTVTVTDVAAPVLSGVPANTSVSCGVMPAVPVVTATDNFDANPVVTMTTTTNGNIVTRTWTAVDASGNTASASQVITLVPDTQAPVLTVPANINATTGTGINVGTATATDNCGTPVITNTSIPVTFALGTTTITWTATDASGNTVSAAQTVTVTDVTAPVLSGVPANISVTCGELPAVPTVTATDNFDMNVVVTMSTTTNGNIVTRTWTATDASGNTASASQQITLLEVSAPVVTVVNNCGSSTLTASGTNLAWSTGASSSSITVYEGGNYTVTQTVNGCTSPAAVINVTIAAAPVVGPITGTTTITAGTTTQLGNNISGGTWSSSNTAVASVNAGGLVSGVSAGNAVISYLVTTPAGCSTTVSTTVTVNSNCVAPVITAANVVANTASNSTGCSSAVTYAVNISSTPAAVVTYTLSGATSGSGNGTGTGVVFNTGVTTVRVTAVNSCGTTSQSFTVTLRDATAPVPNVSTLPTITGQCSVSLAAASTSTSNCECRDWDYRYRGIVSLILYYLNGYYNSNDDDHECDGNNGGTQATNAPKATDNCKGTITGTTTDPLTYTTQGTYTINWKFDDGNGNVTIQQQTVIVRDDVKPVISCPGNITVSCGLSTTPSGCNSTATATDNCGSVNVTYTDVTNGNVITRTWRAQDAAGNFSTCTQTITLVDNTRPTISDVPDVTVGCNASTAPSATGTATATDNCSAVTVTYSDVTSGNVITRTWTARDAAGNTSTSSQKITKGVVFTATVSSVPTSNTYTGGISTNLYLGYGAQSTKLQVCDLPSSGAPYTYAWSGSAISRLNTTSSSAPTFTPNTSGSFTFVVTVTNKYGCTSTDNITICVTDIRVAGSNGSKVYICHKTSSKKNPYQTIQVSINAVPAHLNHNGGCGNNDNDDRLGSCDQTPCNTTSVNSVTTSSTQQTMTAEGAFATVNSTVSKSAATTEEELKVTVMPNPSTTFFTLKFESKYEAPLDLRVMDAAGRIVDSKTKIGANSTLQVGHNYTSGTYYAEISQNGKRKVIQLIKVRG